MDIRKPDEEYNDCLYESVLSEYDRKVFLQSIDEQIYSKSLPDELDDLETLTMKKVFLEEEIQPQLYNFNIHSETYDNVYNQLCILIDIARSSTTVNTPTPSDSSTPENEEKTDKKLTREEVRKARIKFYNKSG